MHVDTQAHTCTHTHKHTHTQMRSISTYFTLTSGQLPGSVFARWQYDRWGVGLLCRIRLDVNSNTTRQEQPSLLQVRVTTPPKLNQLGQLRTHWTRQIMQSQQTATQLYSTMDDILAFIFFWFANLHVLLLHPSSSKPLKPLTHFQTALTNPVRALYVIGVA